MVFAFNIDLYDPAWHNGETGCVFAETVQISATGTRRCAWSRKRSDAMTASYLRPKFVMPQHRRFDSSKLSTRGGVKTSARLY